MLHKPPEYVFALYISIHILLWFKLSKIIYNKKIFHYIEVSTPGIHAIGAWPHFLELPLRAGLKVSFDFRHN